jgi:uncharacterized protein (UPF0335 family)
MTSHELSIPGPGHNSQSLDEQIRDYARRLDDMLDEIDALQVNVKSMLEGAQRKGINPTALKKAIARLRLKRDAHDKWEKLIEREELVERFEQTIGELKSK